MPENYMRRVCDRILQEKLEAKGAVLVKGAKWCGKTTTDGRYESDTAVAGRDSAFD